MQDTTINYAPAEWLKDFTPKEVETAAHYSEQVAGVPDIFDRIHESDWDIAAGLRDDLAPLDVFQMYADLRAWAEHWIGFAHSLRFEARMGDSTEAFRLWTETELDSASNALRGLAGHALDEITGRRKD